MSLLSRFAIAAALVVGLASAVPYPSPAPSYTTGHTQATADPTYASYFPNGNNADWGGYYLGHSTQSDPSQPQMFQNSVTNCFTWYGGTGCDPTAPNSWWANYCPMSYDSDSDGYTDAQEMGDPLCVWVPGATPASTAAPYISDPNDGTDMPTATPAPTAAPTPAATTAAATTAATAGATTAAATTAAADATTAASPTTVATTVAAGPAPTTAAPTTAAPTTAAPTTAAPTTVAATQTAVKTSWKSFCFAWGSSQQTCFKTLATSGAVAGDPHYQLLSGDLVTCDALGWVTLVASAEAVVEVQQVAVGATTATAIAQARVTYKASGRVVVFGATPDAAPVSDADVLVNANGATDVNGRNYVEVQRVATSFGTYLNVLTVFAAPTSGILVSGCPAGTPVYSGQAVASSPACASITDALAQYSCNVDVQRTGSDEFVQMAQGAAQQRAQVQETTAPTSAADAAPQTRTLPAPASAAANPAIIVALVMGCVVLIAAAAAVVYLIKRAPAANAADGGAKVIYVVGDATEGSSTA